MKYLPKPIIIKTYFHKFSGHKSKLLASIIISVDIKLCHQLLNFILYVHYSCLNQRWKTIIHRNINYLVDHYLLIYIFVGQ